MINPLHRKILISFYAILFTFPLLSQVKPPEAETDYIDTYFILPNSVNALQNDYGYEGDSLIIWIISDVHMGEAYFIDSMIYYSPPSNVGVVLADTISYVIKDITTGLYSAPGKVIVNLNRINSAMLNLNNINARINAVGNQFRLLNYVPYGPSNGFESPKGSGLSTIYNSVLWIAGLDEENNLHTACERNRSGQNMWGSSMGFDFWPGPIADSIYYSGDYLMDHNLIWEITREQVEYHMSNYNNPGYFPSQSIFTWPGNGDTTYGIANVLAPFIDQNQNQIYEPLLGDYPAIRGDQCIYFIFNDDYSNHTETLGNKFGIEIHGMAWAYDCPSDSAFYNTIFLKYDIINRSTKNYHDLYLGNYTNLMIGNPTDDLVGCDTLSNSFFAYNKDEVDDTTSMFYPGYMNHPPAQAVVFLNRKINHFIVSSYPTPYWADTSYFNDPNFASEYYGFMKSIWRDSTHLSFGETGYGGNQSSNIIFPGDPIEGTGWNQANSGYEDINPHGIATSGPLAFNSGDTLFLELAYIFARDYEGDNMSSLALLKEYIEQVNWYYDNDSTPCGSSWSKVSENTVQEKDFKIYPNPASTVIYFESDKFVQADYYIYAITGNLVKQGNVTNKQGIITNDLKQGIYFLKLKTDSELKTTSFIKR